MNRTKSILLTATALAIFTAPQIVHAQSVATGVTILSGPATPTPNGENGPDSLILPRAISADGTTVLAQPIPAGNVGTPSDNNIWIWVNGVPQMIAITRSAVPGSEVARQFTPTDMSGDGRTITGSMNSQVSLLDGATLRTYNVPRAVYWTQATGLTLFPVVSATEFVGRLGGAEAAFVNSDGSYFAVSSTPIPYLPDGSRNPALRLVRAHRYSVSGGYEYLGSLGDTVSMSVSGISGAGNVIIGNTVDLAASNQDVNGDAINVGAFRWDAASGLSQLPDLVAAPLNGAIGRATSALDISRDGSTIVGNSRGGDGRTQAVYWRASGIQALGFLPGFDTANALTTATAASGNGSIIGGQGTGGAWLWGATSGMQSVQSLLQNAGISLNGYTISDLNDISDTGEFITGSAFNEGGGLDEFGLPRVVRGYVLSIAAAPPPPSGTVSFLPGALSSTADCSLVADAGSESFAISGDGHFVVGAANSNCLLAWRDGAPQVLDTLSTLGRNGVPIEYASGMSSDGSVIVGSRDSSNNLPFRAPTFIWTATTGSYLPPEPIVGSRRAVGSGYVNSDGTIFAFNTLDYAFSSSFGENVNSGLGYVYRWSAAGSFQEIGRVDASFTMFARGIDGAGNAIVGLAENPSTFNDPFGAETRAFVWRAGSGLTTLPDLSSAPPVGTNRYSEANGISRDGTIIVGQSRGTDGRLQAVYWRGRAITGLGWLPGSSPADSNPFATNVTQALAANATGDIIVGKAIGSTTDLAWRWTSASGMQDLNVFAASAGINLGGFVLTDAVGLSDNGQYITGNSFNAAQSQSRGYVLSIAAAPPTPTPLTTSARLIVTLTLPGVTQTSIVNQSFSTQVDALLNGSTVFTRTVGDQITGSLGVTALADARSALQQTSGLRRIVIGAPTLISNTTTVLSSTSNTVNVASGTQVTTADVITNGPATVATGDLGTCATAATAGVNPTGCSLPGTAVTVNANVINTNTFTNTINSVTPTTTTTVEQLISAQWQVSATAGNQFGTVHALTGVAAFDRGDRLIGQLLNMGGGNGSASNGITRAAMPKRDESGLGGGESGLTMFGGYFGSRSSIDADASIPVARIKGDSDGFVLGLQQALGDTAHIGIAVDHGSSDYTVRDPFYPETLKLKHTQAALFAGWSDGGFSLSGAASYGLGTARTNLLTPTTPAIGKRDINSWSLGAQAGYAVPLGKDASLTPHIGIRHTSAKLKGFTEMGGPTPLLGLSQTVDRTRFYAGLEAKAGIDLGGLTLTPRLYGRIARDSGDASGTADLVFASAPTAPIMQAFGPGVGQTVTELGGSLDTAVGSKVHLWAGYDGTFRDHAKSHTTKVGLTVSW
ncbi:MAG: autotransporter domain-containing protein [Sphingomonadales bacterium]|nr:autotransporter domain-containing protein [Sphingomonadales bacterium]